MSQKYETPVPTGMYAVTNDELAGVPHQ